MLKLMCDWSTILNEYFYVTMFEIESLYHCCKISTKYNPKSNSRAVIMSVGIGVILGAGSGAVRGREEDRSRQRRCPQEGGRQEQAAALTAGGRLVLLASSCEKLASSHV